MHTDPTRRIGDDALHGLAHVIVRLGEDIFRFATVTMYPDRRIQRDFAREGNAQLFGRLPRTAMDFFREWYARAIRSRIEPLKRFARQLRHKIDGILAHCKYPLHTSLLEGMNNKIKVIKRMAYGYRDEDYFFLKIRAAFPGIPG